MKRPVSGLTVTQEDTLSGVITAEALGLGQNVFRFLTHQGEGLAELVAHRGGENAKPLADLV